jgi:putative addiction module component (TIGR02574 family)
MDSGWCWGYDVAMSTAAAILDTALRLPPHARAEIALRLVESLDIGPDDADAEAAWATEVARRIDDLDQGRVGTTPAAEVITGARSRLASHRG